VVDFFRALGQSSKYSGKPRPELDEAWSELLKYSNVRVSADDLRKINRNSIELADGSGDYMAGLDVHHSLHCLKYIRQYLYPDYYNITDPNIPDHLDHCLDNLRELVMCKADISLYTYDWIDNYRKPYPNFNIQHECRNFDAVNDWAKEHSFDIFDGKSLKHPKFGLSFPLNADGTVNTKGFVHKHEPHVPGHVITPLISGVDATADPLPGSAAQGSGDMHKSHEHKHDHNHGH
jgi:hypothetical protein